jgi:Winged helix DNA-binding domain
VKWSQVNSWRLSQHSLSQRLQRQDFVKAVTQTGGIQAQVMSAAELALWARTDGLLVQQVKAALWQDHTLVKTWAMRCTLHLLSAPEFPLYVAARSTHKARNWEYYFSYYGITPAEYAAFIAAVPHIVGSTPMTREQLATALADEIGVPKLRTLITSSGWGSPLKPIEALLPRTYKSLVFRPQGWISAVVLVNGWIKGVWQYKTQRTQTPLKVRMFSIPTTSLKKSIEAESERLGAFLNTKVVLEFENF